ncbi:unnamed protein product [Calypogeia fissa]
MGIITKKHAKVDQIPMLHEEEFSVRSVEMSALEAGGDDFSLKIHDDQDLTQMYGNTGASVGVKDSSFLEDVKHEHLLRSGPMGRCNDPFCTTCPSYFGYSEQPSRLGSAELKHVLLGRASVFGNKAASWGRSWMPGILNPHTKLVNQWNKIFCISSLIAVFIDPIFFFLLGVDANNYCLVFNNSAAVAVTVVRSFTDTIHLFHIFLQFRMAYILPDSKVRGAGELEDNPKRIAIHYLRTWFLLDLFTALPLPQILIWTVVKRALAKESGANYAKDVLRVVVLVQNIPRSIRFFPLLIGRTPSGFVFETAWSNFVINLLMYLLAGHIVGSCWYLFGVQRVNVCLAKFCDYELGGQNSPNGTFFQCQKSFLDCGADGDTLFTLRNDHNYSAWRNNTAVFNNCLSSSPNFSYGIYGIGIPVYTETVTIDKYISSLFWGFLQISTLAGNQQPSIFVWEVLFTLGIVALGLLLFALLIGNMQNFLQALQRRKLDMQLKRYDTEVWMKQRRLPQSLRKRVKEAGRFRWVATGGVEEQELIGDLPEDLQKDIQRYLCLDLVKKVRLFELLEDHVLDAICERLYQKLYIEGSEIFREKKPVERMLFIVRGKLESRGEDGSSVPLKEGDFCGEELLSWYIDRTGVSTSKKAMSKQHRAKHPLSSRTVRCLTSVEAFSLESDSLEYITTHYKPAFRSPRVQGVIRYLSLYWRSLAAIRIQKAWRASRERRTSGAFASTSSQIRRLKRFDTINRGYV